MSRTVPGLDSPQDEAWRVRQSANPHAEPEVLQALAADRSVTVRTALALNPMAPPAVTRTLADDPDERVRLVLARRLAGLLPGMPDQEHARLQQEAHATLTSLATDAAVRVRAAVADVLKDMPQAPRALILQLAHDRDIMVSTPVILFSPRLATNDLLELIAGAPCASTVIAVAGRSGLDARVSDAIAATADSAAIRALLCNRMAQIREATLDALIARAVDHADWHEPLVQRPSLHPRAIRALSEIVATHLLEVLSERADLSEEQAHELRSRLTARLEAEKPKPHRDATMQEALAAAQALAKSGRLTEDIVLAATSNGDVPRAAALLSVASGTPISVVMRAASLRSAKGLVSLVWKAGFGMRTAVALQIVLGRLSPDTILRADSGGTFPMGIEEMRWQLEFLGRMGG